VSLVRLRPVWMTNHPPSVLWHCWLCHQTCKNRRPYNLYCVGADIKPCSIKPVVVLFTCVVTYWFTSFGTQAQHLSLFGHFVRMLNERDFPWRTGGDHQDAFGGARWKWMSQCNPHVRLPFLKPFELKQSCCHAHCQNFLRVSRGSRPLVTPYYCRLGDLLCFVFMSAYCMFDLSVYYLFLRYFDTVGWVFWPVKTISHITYTAQSSPMGAGHWAHWPSALWSGVCVGDRCCWLMN